MSLLITKKKSVFYLNGCINSKTTNIFKTYFKNISKEANSLTINIDGVNEIDKKGISILKKLRKENLEKGGQFFITGIGCKEIHEELKAK